MKMERMDGDVIVTESAHPIQHGAKLPLDCPRRTLGLTTIAHAGCRSSPISSQPSFLPSYCKKYRSREAPPSHHQRATPHGKSNQHHHCSIAGGRHGDGLSLCGRSWSPSSPATTFWKFLVHRCVNDQSPGRTFPRANDGIARVQRSGTHRIDT